MGFISVHGCPSYVAHFHALSIEIHFDQRVSHQVSEATAIEVAVGTGVVLVIVNLGELQTPVVMELLSMEVLMGAEHLKKKKGEIKTRI